MLEAPYGDALVERLMFATRVIIGGTCAIDEDLMRLTVQNWARSAGMYTYLPTSIDRDLPAATDPEETVPINLIDALEDDGATADREDVSPSSRQPHELQSASPSARSYKRRAVQADVPQPSSPPPAIIGKCVDRAWLSEPSARRWMHTEFKTLPEPRPAYAVGVAVAFKDANGNVTSSDCGWLLRDVQWLKDNKNQPLGPSTFRIQSVRDGHTRVMNGEQWGKGRYWTPKDVWARKVFIIDPKWKDGIYLGSRVNDIKNNEAYRALRFLDEQD